MLTGLKVLELANILAGPMIGQFCAELGADVVKVEQPGAGDPTRGWRLADESPENDISAYFSCANWGKRSIALDMVDDHDTVVSLLRRSDVVIVGSSVSDGPTHKEAPPGDVQAFDVHTGKLAWTFHNPPVEGETGYDTWKEGSAEYTGNANIWTNLTADPELGLV